MIYIYIYIYINVIYIYTYKSNITGSCQMRFLFAKFRHHLIKVLGWPCDVLGISDIDQQNTGDVYGGFLKWWYSKPSKSLHHFDLDTYSFGVQFKKPPYGRMIALS